MSITENETNYLYNFSPRPEMEKYIPQATKRVLDVGCGSGGFCKTLNKNGREVWGMEMNKDAANQAKQYCHKILIGDFDSLYPSLPNNYFDCITFTDVLEHMYAPWEVIAKCKNLLSPEGVLVVSLPNFLYIGNFIEVVIHREFEYKENGILDITHLRFFTKKSMIKMFERENYKIINIEGINPRINDWKVLFLKLISLGKLSESKFKQFAIVAKPQ